MARKVAEIADRVDLTGILDARPAGLSSGQKQRVSLARALVREPDVLLLDEPLSHLDAAQRDTTRRELKRIQRDLGHTTILVTHDQEEALSLADRIAVMKDGVIQQLGTPFEIYDSPANVFVADFVGEPAINLLPGIADRDGHARLSAAVRIALPDPVPAGREVVVGIRPEDLHLTGDEGLPARVVAHEPLLEVGHRHPRPRRRRALPRGPHRPRGAPRARRARTGHRRRAPHPCLRRRDGRVAAMSGPTSEPVSRPVRVSPPVTTSSCRRCITAAIGREHRL